MYRQEAKPLIGTRRRRSDFLVLMGVWRNLGVGTIILIVKDRSQISFVRVYPLAIPYLYQYGVGAVIFAIGIRLILARGSCVLSRRQDRFWFGVLIAGFVWYAGIHLTWYLAAIYINPIPR